MCECCGQDDKGVTIQVIKPGGHKEDTPPANKPVEAESK